MRNDYLEHHGIQGMKWGKRNGPPYPLTAAAKSAAEKAGKVAGSAKESYKKTKNILKSDSGSRKSKAFKEAREKDIDELSTQQLREINSRLREEKSYQELTKGNISEGKKFVKQTATAVASGVITGVAIEAGKTFLKTLPQKSPYYMTTLIRILSKVS